MPKRFVQGAAPVADHAPRITFDCGPAWMLLGPGEGAALATRCGPIAGRGQKKARKQLRAMLEGPELAQQAQSSASNVVTHPLFGPGVRAGLGLGATGHQPDQGTGGEGQWDEGKNHIDHGGQWLRW